MEPNLIKMDGHMDPLELEKNLLSILDHFLSNVSDPPVDPTYNNQNKNNNNKDKNHININNDNQDKRNRWLKKDLDVRSGSNKITIGGIKNFFLIQDLPGIVMMEACKFGNLEMVEYIHNNCFQEKSYQGPYDSKVLNTVVKLGHLDVLKFIKKTLDNQMKCFDWYTAFITSIQDNQPKSLNLIINFKKECGIPFTPYQIPHASIGYPILKCLRDNGLIAFTPAADKGNKSLDYNIQHPDVELIEFLINIGYRSSPSVAIELVEKVSYDCIFMILEDWEFLKVSDENWVEVVHALIRKGDFNLLKDVAKQFAKYITSRQIKVVISGSKQYESDRMEMVDYLKKKFIKQKFYNKIL